MKYEHKEIEEKWQKYWVENKTYQTKENPDKEKFYVLDMFPYPSGAGLHVGHPLGYIASDIYARYKKLRGYNVLHPMGYDAFGLPAEQYAIQTGQHPSKTTEKNLGRYRGQLDRIGFSFDWSREVRTSDPKYYRWTQWIFIQLFNSWYNKETEKAEPIETLVGEFEKAGNLNVNGATSQEDEFTAGDWKEMNEEEKQAVLLKYRLTYLSESVVNWCPALGTVLANDEVKDGVSERGGHPVVQKKMKQWSMRITAYADRLLKGLQKLDWTDSMKEIQNNWIGKSYGASLHFDIEGYDEKIEVFTTRPDTIFGVTYMTLAPEHQLIDKITTPEQKKEVEEYREKAAVRSERERMSDVKNVTGVFTGAYSVHPFSGEKIPVWIGDYVLAEYGTGAVMAVPAHDSRDYAFATYFNLPIKEVVKGGNIKEEAFEAKEGELINSDFLNGLNVKKAIKKAVAEIEKKEIGEGKVNYRLRDAVFSRQRYWGEPFPVYYKGETPYVIEESELPLTLPQVDKYLPTESGEPPLARAKNWETADGNSLETNTMPGWAGSSWYFLRYMDPHNEEVFVSREKVDYWKNVDLYIGGAEHATGHLLYARFWTKFLYDRGFIPFDEPFKKLINQGMILGNSAYVYKVKADNKFVSFGLRKEYKTVRMHVDINLLDGDELDIEAFKKWRPEFETAEFEMENGKYICGREVEKMSKSKYNVQTPDDLCEEYGADTLRMYEMFLGPIDEAKPWDTKGIEGVYRFLKKLWRLFHSQDEFSLSDEEAEKDELKVLHKTIKKVGDDIERFSFNTVVSELMICVNALSDLNCNKRSVLEPLIILLSPYAPHIAEELWSKAGHKESITKATFPSFDEKYLKQDSHKYPIQFNGKVRFTMEINADLSKEEIEQEVLALEKTKQYTGDKVPKRVIVVPGKIVNIVI